MDMESIMMKPIFMAFVVSIVLTGCASSSAPNLDAHFGEAVNAAKAQQIINPDASLNVDPVAGLDGQAADAAMSRYHRSFVQPTVTPNVFNIGVSSGASGMTGGSGGASGTSR
jgi:PBP1b-binding outer membrane lipoprotein LpoB